MSEIIVLENVPWTGVRKPLKESPGLPLAGHGGFGGMWLNLPITQYPAGLSDQRLGRATRGMISKGYVFFVKLLSSQIV